MTFTIISHVLHKRNKNGDIGGYAPYIREMNIWLKYVDRVVLVAPCEDKEFGAIDIAYKHDNIEFIRVPQIRFTSLGDMLRSTILLPYIVFKVVVGMRKGDHIHLRCPGNMGLIGCLVQHLFPKKIKTAKYAGNWDWDSLQPKSYRWQQRLLQSEWWSKNMTVLVYGKWEPWTNNLKSFFTATYSKNEVNNDAENKTFPENEVRLIFVGGLTKGKRPMLALEAIKLLKEVDKRRDYKLTFLGEGNERKEMERFISDNEMGDNVRMMGNVDGGMVKDILQESHFLIFVSMSEGWPKAVAEAMFWGCLPITSSVSCVPMMVDNGERGMLVNADAEDIVRAVNYYLDNKKIYQDSMQKAMGWSREFTMERFESEVRKLLI